MTDNCKQTIAKRRASLLDELAALASPPPVLVGVSKRQPETRIEAALAAGQRVFGENRVQEAQSRWLARRADWPGLQLRLVGPLQTNKAEEAVALFDVIETLDRAKLVHALATAMQKLGLARRCLIQVNTGEEPQKAGVAPDDLADLIGVVRASEQINLVGLMCIPPVDAPGGPHFALLAKLAARHGLSELSMGMSGDYQTAARLGATHVRLGTALFGARD